MAHVTLTIAGRSYQVACGDGQEEQVIELGRELDRRARLLSGVNGAVSEGLLLVLVGLMVADEVTDARARASSAEEMARHSEQSARAATVDLQHRVAELETRLADMNRALETARQRLEQYRVDAQEQQDAEEVIARSIETLAGRIESVAETLTLASAHGLPQ